jgi:4-hydroxy-tetrahydrodipicolinate synthase
MIAAYEKGDVVGARDINARLADSYAYSNSDTCVFSQATKAMMRVLGLAVGECRLPLGPAPAGTETRARKVLADLG